MKIETKYRDGLKTLMKTTSLDEINVVMLCEHVKSNRQTFYYHYRDLSDVVESIFLKERIGYGTKIYDFDNIIKPLIAYINSNNHFLLAVASSFACDKLENFLYSYFYQKTTQYLKNAGKFEDINNADLQAIIRYICSLFSNEMFYWLTNKNKEKQTHLHKRLTIIWNYFVEEYPHKVKGLK